MSGLTDGELVALRRLVVVATAAGLLAALGGQLAAAFAAGLVLSAVGAVLLLDAIVEYVVLIVRMRSRARRIDRESNDWRP